MRILSNEDVAALMGPVAAFEVVAQAMRAVSDLRAQMPLRSVVPVGDKNFMGVMPGALAGAGFGVKLVSLFPGNPARGLSGHRGALVLFEPDAGGAVAMMDAGLVTALRTAAASAVAARALARPEARVLCVIGAGEQALHHFQAFAAQFPLSDIRLVARRAEAGQALARQVPDLPVTLWSDAKAAVAGADLVVTVTNSATPVLHGAWLEPGQHLSIVGASIASKREVDDAVVQRADVWVDYLPSALAQAGEIVDMIAAGRMQAHDLRGEIGAVLNGALPGRQDAQQITAYRSLGVIAQDLACAAWLLEQACARGMGHEVAF